MHFTILSDLFFSIIQILEPLSFFFSWLIRHYFFLIPYRGMERETESRTTQCYIPRFGRNGGSILYFLHLFLSLYVYLLFFDLFLSLLIDKQATYHIFIKICLFFTIRRHHLLFYITLSNYSPLRCRKGQLSNMIVKLLLYRGRFVISWCLIEIWFAWWFRIEQGLFWSHCLIFCVSNSQRFCGRMSWCEKFL